MTKSKKLKEHIADRLSGFLLDKVDEILHVEIRVIYPFSVARLTIDGDEIREVTEGEE